MSVAARTVVGLVLAGAAARTAASATISAAARIVAGVITWALNRVAVPTPTDPDRIYVVPPESRTITIDPDVRVHLVPFESRATEIDADDRGYLIHPETRQAVFV